MKNDYSSTDERKEWEKKWQTIKELRSAYRTYGNADFPLLTTNLTAGGKYPLQILEGILNNFIDLKCFKAMSKKKGSYKITGIDSTVLENLYKSIGKIYKRYASYHENSKPVKKTVKTYITKDGDDFKHNNRLLIKLSKNTNYYKVFCSLYELIPEGGEVTYSELGNKIKTRIPKTKGYSTSEMIKFIQSNLTDQNNGFLHYTKIKNIQDNGIPLISIKERGRSIFFNNMKG